MTDKKTVTVNIISRWDSSKILFRAKVDASIEECFRVRAALEIGVKARADLSGASLSGAYLSGANLSGAYLSGANLVGANLSGADLSGADLSGANLSGAYLSGANLSGAYLSGAYLSGADLSGANLSGANLSGASLGDGLKLAGDRPFFSIGSIGSVSRTFFAWITTQGLRLQAGCFFGTREEFIASVNDTHGESDHAKEYLAALALIDVHVELWTPKADESQEAA